MYGMFPHPIVLRPLPPRQMNKRWLMWSGGAVALGLVLWLGLRSSGAGEQPARSGDTATVARRTFAPSVVAIGTIKPQIGAEVRVGSRISGRVRRLRVNIGDHVERGQVIAELESEELDALVAERRAAVTASEAAIASARATAALAAAELARQEQLQEQRVSTRAEAEVARERHAVATAQLASAAAAAERSRAELESALVQRSFAVLTSPIAGVVASVATQQGETIAAGLNAPTFLTVVDLGRLQVNTYVDEVDIGKIEVAQHAVFTVDAFPSRDFEGSVSAIYPSATIQDNVVKYVAAVRIGKDGGVLRPEMTANVSIRLKERSVLAIPARAIRREGGRSVVYVTGGRSPEAREVRVGWRDGAWVEVLRGLTEGERILVDPPAGADQPR